MYYFVHCRDRATKLAINIVCYNQDYLDAHLHTTTITTTLPNEKSINFIRLHVFVHFLGFSQKSSSQRSVLRRSPVLAGFFVAVASVNWRHSRIYGLFSHCRLIFTQSMWVTYICKKTNIAWKWLIF